MVRNDGGNKIGQGERNFGNLNDSCNDTNVEVMCMITTPNPFPTPSIHLINYAAQGLGLSIDLVNCLDLVTKNDESKMKNNDHYNVEPKFILGGLKEIIETNPIMQGHFYDSFVAHVPLGHFGLPKSSKVTTTNKTYFNPYQEARND